VQKKIIRRSRVLEITGLSTSTITRREKAGDFPERIQLGPNSVGWYEDEVLAWVSNLKRKGCLAPKQALEARGAVSR
jgi:prophage regulatory protein